MPREDNWVAVAPEFSQNTEAKVAPPVSAYQFFQREMTQSIKQEVVKTNNGVNPDVGSLTRAVSEHWRGIISPQSKARFEHLAREDRTRYARESHAREVARLQRQENLRKDREVGILAEGQRRTRRTVIPTVTATTNVTASTRKPRAATQRKRASSNKGINNNSDEESFKSGDDSEDSEAGEGEDLNDYGSCSDQEEDDSGEDDDSDNDDRPRKKKIKNKPLSSFSTKKKKPTAPPPAVAVVTAVAPPKALTSAQHRAKQEKAERESYIASRQNKLRSERAEQAKRRLQFLLGQSDIFSHFGNVKEDKSQLLSRGSSRSNSNSNSNSKPTTTNGEGGAGGGGGGGGGEEEGGTASVHRRGEASASAGEHDNNVKASEAGTHHEEEEDELANPENDYSMATYLTQQPKEIGFGKMREYQLEGLNWMIRLQENGVNGILAGAYCIVPFVLCRLCRHNMLS
jgi:hypothetical protein